MIRNKTTAARALLLLALTGLLITGCNTRNVKNEPTAGEQFADVAAVRPMTLGYSVVGALAWVVTLPFTLPSGESERLGQEWVMDPLRYTFRRPAGQMEKEDVLPPSNTSMP